MSKLTQWLLGKQRQTRGETLAALDVGSSKIVCLVARADEGSGQMRIAGIGHKPSDGVRNGLVSDIGAAARAITSAVEAAEHMAGDEDLSGLIVSISGPQVFSQTVGVDLALNGREISAADIERLKIQSQNQLSDDQQGHAPELIHAIPVEYSLDGKRGVRDPLGMIGNSLHAKMHMVSAGFGPARTLAAAVSRCHLEVEQIVAAPYASGLACLVEDEMNLGCTVVDMGAGTTSVGVFFDGRLIFADGVPMGGANITNDIARGLTTTFAHAERLKTLHGTAMPGHSDSREIIDVPQVGEEGPEFDSHISKAQMGSIIQPRAEEILEVVRTRLERSGFGEIAGRRVVLTGGGSQLTGIRELAQRVMDKQVRLGRPLRVSPPYVPLGQHSSASSHAVNARLAESLNGPEFVTAAGLLAAAAQPDAISMSSGMDHYGGNVMEKLNQWMRQSA